MCCVYLFSVVVVVVVVVVIVDVNDVDKMRRRAADTYVSAVLRCVPAQNRYSLLVLSRRT